MIVVLMGVSGSGKTTVGRILANILGWPFIEGDDYHPPANIAKMARSEPLTDSDRTPWLNHLNQVICEYVATEHSVILACSALKQSYREHLAKGIPDIQFIYLRGEQALIAERLHGRADHYMPSTLLDSQFEALEEPDSKTVTMDIDQPPDTIAGSIRSLLGI